MKQKYINIKAALFLLLAGILSACVSDDTSECVGKAYLRFSYTHNKPLTDLLLDQVDYINLFFYDRQGNLCETRNVSVANLDTRNGVQLDMAPGDYTVVAWGNNDEDKFELKDVSSLNGLRLSLREDAEGYLSDIGGLFYGKTSLAVSTVNRAEGQVALIKNTNHIRIVLVDVTPRSRAADPIPGTDLRVRLIGCNWLYDHENGLDPVTRGNQKEYRPANSINAENLPQAEFDILRMFADNSCQLEFMVEDVRYPDAEPVKREQLTAKIIETIPEVNNDDDLNRYDDFEVRVEVEQVEQTWVYVRMFINNWEVNDSEGGI